MNVGSKLPPATYIIHTDFLKAVPFFKATLSVEYSFKEANTSTVDLPEVDPKVFEYFIQWLYTRQAAPSVDCSLAHPALKSSPPAFFHLIRLYNLGNFLSCEELRNDCLDMVGTVAEKMNAAPSANDTQICWEMEEESKSLKALVLDLFCYMNISKLMIEENAEWYVHLVFFFLSFSFSLDFFCSWWRSWILGIF